MELDVARGIAAGIWCEPNHYRRVMDPALCDSFAHVLVEQCTLENARKTMAEAVDKVDSGYEANVAMLIHDDQNGETPANLKTKADCNALARVILKKIFT